MMATGIGLFCVAALLICSASAGALEFPRPPAGHPRLLLRPADIPRIRERYRSPQMEAVRSALLEEANAAPDGRLPDGKPEVLWESRNRRRVMEAKAFLFLIEGDETMGRQAVQMALDYLSSITATYSDNSDYHVSASMHASILSAAIVYDWCYPLLSEEQKAELVRQIKRVCGQAEYGWPPVEGVGFVTGHYSELKPVCMLAAGIAAYDEEPAIHALMADHLYRGFAPARNFFCPGHKHHQGIAYGIARFANEVAASFLVAGMGLPNPCVPDQGKVLDYFLYARQPDGLFMVEGDDFSRSMGPGWSAAPDAMFMLAAMHGNPHALHEALRHGTSRMSPALRMVVQDERLEPRPPDGLPLTRYFPSPFGQMIARTGWDLDGGRSSPVAIARFHVKEWMFGNHDHLDAGHFSLYYKGSLAIDSGVYQGPDGGYGSDHFKNYYQRSVAHNTLLVLDPDEPTPRWWDRPLDSRDGGQFWPSDRAEYRTVAKLKALGPRAQILAHEFGPDAVSPDYSYLKGDLARAYQAPAPYPPKVSEVKRSFVFLNLRDARHPAALIVFDRVTSRRPGFRKSWLLHSINEPAVGDGVVTIARTEEGYNGELVNHVLLPAPDNRDLVKIGGPGQEFWVDGRNYPHRHHARGNDETGAWRIELSPRRAAQTDLFLNVMQVMDAVGGPPPLAPAMVETDLLAGVALADRVVLFSKTGERLAGEVAFSVTSVGREVRFLVTDVAEGGWRVEGPVRLDLESSPEGGALWFQGPPGEYRLRMRD